MTATDDVGIFLAPIIQEESSDMPTTLLRKLEATGKLTTKSPETQLLVKRLYIQDHQSADTIADRVKIKPAFIKRWAVMYGWDEERDRRIFNKWRKVNDFSVSTRDVEHRADRLFGSVEQVAEEILMDHQNGEAPISVKELSTLAGCLKITTEARLAIRGQRKSKKVEHTHVVDGKVTHDHSGKVDVSLLHEIGSAICDLTGQNDKMQKIENKNLISVTSRQDMEFEELGDES